MYQGSQMIVVHTYICIHAIENMHTESSVLLTLTTPDISIDSVGSSSNVSSYICIHIIYKGMHIAHVKHCVCMHLQ